MAATVVRAMAAMNATMRAVIWNGHVNQVSVMSVPVPTIINATDAIVRVTDTAICGTDLHIYHGDYGSTNAPWGLGHEAIGYVSQVGSAVENRRVGDYVVIPDNLDSGHFELQPEAAVSFGLGADYGDTAGCQAEYVRVPFADLNLIPIPATNNNGTNISPVYSSIQNHLNGTTNSTSNLQAYDYLMVADIFSTAWGGLDYAGFEYGDTVAIFGAGPVGLLAAYSAFIRGAVAVHVVDHVQARLNKAASIGAVPINFAHGDPIKQIMRYEPNGVRRSVDCIGFEAVNDSLRPQENIVLQNMVAVTGMMGGIGGIGIFSSMPNSTGTPRAATLPNNVLFRMADFFTKGLSMQSGGVNIRERASMLVDLISVGKANPGFVVSSVVDIEDAPAAYRRFDDHQETKVVIHFP